MTHKTTTKQVANAFGISLASAWRLAQRPDCPAIRVGGTWRWPDLESVQAWLRERTSDHRTGRMTSNR